MTEKKPLQVFDICLNVRGIRSSSSKMEKKGIDMEVFSFTDVDYEKQLKPLKEKRKWTLIYKIQQTSDAETQRS